MRLKHPDMQPAAAPVRIRFDGAEIEALPGETIAAALAAADIVAVRRARSGAPRGPYCGMGVCFDCLVTVDGRPSQRACLTKVAPGMDVRTSPVATSQPTEPALPAEEIACDVLVVGAGPAGLTAARSLALVGIDVIVADERLHPGGQYFKPLAPSQAAEISALDRQFRDGAVLHQSAVSAGVKILNETTIWAAFSPTEVAGIVAGRSTLFRPKRLVLATGAYEQSVPVPGWTLPGVMSVGGLQTLARSYRVAPGQRIVIAGNGPLCLQTAAELRQGGANVVAVLESAPRPSFSRLPAVAAAAWADPLLFLSGLSLAAGLRDVLHWRRRVTRLFGDDRVRGVEAADLSISADVVALGYGFASSSELARSLGCAHRYVTRGYGSMETLTDEDGRTSVPDVFAIGDGARFAGAMAARAQGLVVAAAIARDLGRPVPPIDVARRGLRRSERFQAALWRLFEAAPLQAQVLADDALVCRCEEVRADTLRSLVKSGHDTPGELKRATRVGMGRCQGRYCAAAVARMCSPEVGEFGLFAPRPPAKPVPIRLLSVEQPEWSGHKDFVPPNMARPVETEPLPLETVDTLVIGGGVAGCCLAYWLAREGIETMVVERDDVNMQASGANAGSLHVQLLSFDFGRNAPAGGNRAADTLPLGPASIALWQEIQRDTKQDLEVKVSGGLMLAETADDVAFLKAKIALEKSRGIEAELIGANELRQLEPCIGDVAIAAEWCPGEGKINPLRATYAVVARAKEMGARFRRGSDVQSIARTGSGWTVTTSRGDIRCSRIVNASGPWAAEVAAMVGVTIPVRGAPLQMIVTEPTAPTLSRLVAHAARHLTLKQMASGAFMVGGGWTAGLDERHKLSRALRSSVEGNLWVASRVVPALADLHAIRIWAGMNVNIDRAPILGEVPELPGFYNCVSSNGYTLAPVLSRLTAEMIAGRSTSLPVEPYSIRRFS
jgi:glycine/D-amino acid oxidase-like deaminating enzyme/bacterioferritin-associated ferredoxin